MKSPTWNSCLCKRFAGSCFYTLWFGELNQCVFGLWLSLMSLSNNLLLLKSPGKQMNKMHKIINHLNVRYFCTLVVDYNTTEWRRKVHQVTLYVVWLVWVFQKSLIYWDLISWMATLLNNYLLQPRNEKGYLWMLSSLNLEACGLQRQKITPGPIQSARNRKLRLQFGNWTVDHWKHVAWSDESQLKTRINCALCKRLRLVVGL